jgi:hypothetical protein
MGVAVNLPHSGWILMASDHIYLSASYGDPFMGNLLNQDPRRWAHSALKVRRLVEKYRMRVLPGHVAVILRRWPNRNSFYEGCLVYVEDPTRGADEDDDGDEI